MSSNALAASNNAQVTTNEKRREIKHLLEGPQLKAAVQAALPKHLSAERFIRTAITATMRTPKLLQCTQESFFQCLLDLSAYGLEADGRRAHLIPYGNVCTLIIDYKGIAELVRRSGDVSYIHADVVYEGDAWDFQFGTDAKLIHKPKLDRPDTAKQIAFYSFVKLKDGSEDFIVLSPGEVAKIRKRSKASGNGPWVTDYDEMGKKTAFRRHSKWLPLSADIRDAIEHGEESDFDLGKSLELAETMKAAISLDQVTAGTDENRGHDATQPETTDGGKPTLKHLGSKNKIAIYNTLPDPLTVTHGQKVYVRVSDDPKADELFVFDLEYANGDGTTGQFMRVFE